MRTAVAMLATTLIAGCASGPYAYLDDSYRGAKADVDLYPLSIKAVDGKLRGVKPVRVEPGDHVVVAESLRPVRMRENVREQAFGFRALPCVRYVLGAKHRDSLSEAWEPVVVEERPIAGCSEETAGGSGLR